MVSERITAVDIKAVSAVVQRKVTIWDNLHANDYDQTRVYLGPYSGHETALVQQLSGVLTNPNCEFHVNFIALHTLAQWAGCSSEQPGNYTVLQSESQSRRDNSGWLARVK